MPTVSSHDVLGPMPWGAGGNARQRYFPQDSLDRSDARSGINSLLFEESGAAGACGVSVAAPSEHAYSSNRNSLVSANGYYGFHQQHGAAAADQDCTMDTDASENNPPGAHCAFGGSPSAGAVQEAFPLGSPHLWNADPLRIGLGSLGLGFAATRKRNLEARGLPLLPRGGWCEGVDAEDMGCGAKRTRPSLPSPKDAALAAQAMTEAPSQAMAHEGDSFGMQVSAPSTSEQSHTPALVYELPIHQLPGSTSQLADAMTPRPRCLMGHFI